MISAQTRSAFVAWKNRYPPSDQVRGHAFRDHAPAIVIVWSLGGSRATPGIHDTVDRRDPACLRLAPQLRQMPQQPRPVESCGRSTPALPGSGSSRLQEPSMPPLSTLDGTVVAAIVQFG